MGFIQGAGITSGNAINIYSGSLSSFYRNIKKMPCRRIKLIIRLLSKRINALSSGAFGTIFNRRKIKTLKRRIGIARKWQSIKRCPSSSSTGGGMGGMFGGYNGGVTGGPIGQVIPGGVGTTSLAGGYGSIPRPYSPGQIAPIPRPSISNSRVPYHTHNVVETQRTTGPQYKKDVRPIQMPIPNIPYPTIPKPVMPTIGPGNMTNPVIMSPGGMTTNTGMTRNYSGSTNWMNDMDLR
jgi:hypothetical protein